ncbi:MAG: 4a-hydroxytetrahydrobiopterin dehydratase [Candidatus Micrarchaeota archaeon]|nr:4a-hydroxytetrahydrobiopterin dehydratase [Candidatus Micrarchaeota archaeon]
MKFERMRCKPCEGGVKKMQMSAARRYMPMVEGWKLTRDKISRELKFKDFKKAMKFTNKVATLAEREGHHPDISIYDWNRMRLELSTHAIGGLSQNDFIMAAKINKILKGS